MTSAITSAAPPMRSPLPPLPPPLVPTSSGPRWPNNAASRRCRLRQISSRSGGPPWGLLRFPHWGSLSDIFQRRVSPSGAAAGKIAAQATVRMVGRCTRGRVGSWNCANIVARAVGTFGQGCARKTLAERYAQIGAAGARQRAQTDGRDGTTGVALDARRNAGQIHLVVHAQPRNVGGTDLGEHLVDGVVLRIARGGAGVDDLQQQVGVGRLAERRAKRGDEIVRQVADEADGVGNDQRLRKLYL